MLSPLAVFGIDSDGLNLAIKLLAVLLAFIYLAVVYYTLTDARRRIADPIVVGCATLAALVFPFVGTVIYMIVRPPEYLDDVRERELEMQAAEAQMHSMEYFLCPHCDHQVEKDFLRCPSCTRKLKNPCENCRKPLDPEWQLCPYCEAAIPGRAPVATPRRRRRSQAEEPAVTE